MSAEVAARKATVAVSSLGQVALGAAATIVATQISIPLFPVPFTLQTLAVMGCGLALGARKAFAAQATYVAIGVAGAPVFSNGGFGLTQLTGPTGGYLVGFMVCAWLVGLAKDRGFARGFWRTAATLLVGEAALFTLGWAYLTFLLKSPEVAFAKGVVPFLLTEPVKAMIAASGMSAIDQFRQARAVTRS